MVPVLFENLPFNLAKTVTHLYELLKVKAVAKGLEMELLIDERLPETLLGDRLRLNQVLVNLMDNAIRFTDWGKISIAVIVTEDHADRCCIRFTVRDTGIGISEKKPAGLFERTLQPSGKAAQVNLNAARHLVCRMGGQLTVNSSSGSGSCFGFSLPFKKQ